MLHEMLHDGFVKVFKHMGRFEIVKVTDSVAVLIHDIRMNLFVLVEQFRPAIQFSDCDTLAENDLGMLLEVPAGRFDVDLSIEQLIVKEVQEETGITIIENDIELINGGRAMALSPGVLTEHMYLAYVEIDSDVNKIDDSKFHGNKEENELTKRILLPVKDVIKQMTFRDMKTYTLIQWFIANKAAEFGLS